MVESTASAMVLTPDKATTTTAEETTTTTSQESTTVASSSSPRLHDCLALGQIAVGLPMTTAQSSYLTNPTVRQEEIHRLPLLLRILHQSRPLTSIPTLSGLDKVGSDGVTNNRDDDDDDDDDVEKVMMVDPLIEEVVARLEDRAALYSDAEGVHTIACHLAPAVCTRISRVPPLQRHHHPRRQAPRDVSSSALLISQSYDTTQLRAIAEDPFATTTMSTAASASATSNVDKPSKKQRRLSTLGQQTSVAIAGSSDHGGGNSSNVVLVDLMDEDDLHGRSDFSDDDEGMDHKDHNKDATVSLLGDTTTTSSETTKRKRKSEDRRRTASLAFSNASEDSPEFLVLKTLQELTRLTVDSLQQQPNVAAISSSSNSSSAAAAVAASDDTANGTADANAGASDATTTTTTLQLATDDSIIAEPARQAESEGGALVSGDLGAIIASLMHHAPALRHRHVASALCRSTVPQAPALIARMGANCPTAVPSLVVGCVDVYQQAQLYKSTSIANVCVQAVRQLAHLSPREAHRVLAVLRRTRQEQNVQQSGGWMTGVMPDLQLELCMQHDTLSTCYLLIRHLSRNDLAADTESYTERFDVTNDVSGDVASTSGAKSPRLMQRSKSTMQSHLEDNPDLLIRTMKFLCDGLKSNSQSLSNVCILLTAYSKLLSQVSIDRLIQQSTKSKEWAAKLLLCLSDLRIYLDSVRRGLDEGNMDESAKTGQASRSFDLGFVAVISTVNVLVSMNALDSWDDNIKNTVEFLKLAFSLRIDTTTSLTTHNLVGRTALAVKYSDSKSLHEIFALTLQTSDDPFLGQPPADQRHTYWAKFCQWAIEMRIVDSPKCEGDFYMRADSLDPTFALQLMDCKEATNDIKTTTATNLLRKVLFDGQNACRFLSLGQSVVSFVESACMVLLDSPGPQVPLVMPIDIEMRASVILLYNSKKLLEKESVMILQLLYCFLFLQHATSSLFKFDPRLLPLKQIYQFCYSPAMLDVNKHVAVRVLSLIYQFCPEVKPSHKYVRLSSRRDTRHRRDDNLPIRTEILNRLKKYVAEPLLDPCGYLAEQAFDQANTFLSDADVVSNAVGALLSLPMSPQLFFTYPMLYRDPLVLLKCSLKVWNRRGTRRIALRVLTTLLEINEFVVHEDSASEDVATEFLSCRNEIVLRSLLLMISSMSPEEVGSLSKCGLTIGLCRKMIARHDGLVGMMIKQGLSESEIDWLTLGVPELMEDASALKVVLSDRGSLTASERLVAADGILRIVILQGFRSSDVAKALAYAALTQLLNSFFLIIGPVGVPVNTLVGEGTGLDASQASRKAAFRMLGAIQKVRGYRTHLRNECILIIQKFAGMCKGESIVGPVPVAAGQKVLLKELSESIVKVMETLGSSMLG